MKENKFCPLCGKGERPSLEEVTLGAVGGGEVPIKVHVCSLCQVVIHNVKRLFEDGERQVREKRKKEAQEKLSGRVGG